jgi:hypothetical protein
MNKQQQDKAILAFEGLNESYIEMEKQNNSIAPKCHFKPMEFMNGDGDDYSNTWWECSTCGHAKDIL